MRTLNSPESDRRDTVKKNIHKSAALLDRNGDERMNLMPRGDLAGA
jgi:hypothetical protein